MRFNDTVTLVSELPARQDASGAWQPGERVEEQRFCNAYTVGASAWESPLDAGMRVEAEVQLRTLDYGGQPRAVYHGTEYDVARVTASGDLTRLQLGRRIGNG